MHFIPSLVTSDFLALSILSPPCWVGTATSASPFQSVASTQWSSMAISRFAMILGWLNRMMSYPGNLRVNPGSTVLLGLDILMVRMRWDRCLEWDHSLTGINENKKPVVSNVFALPCWASLIEILRQGFFLPYPNPRRVPTINFVL